MTLAFATLMMLGKLTLFWLLVAHASLYSVVAFDAQLLHSCSVQSRLLPHEPKHFSLEGLRHERSH